MKTYISEEMLGEMQEIEELFKQGLLPWFEDLSPYINKLDSDLTFKYFPVLVIKSYKSLGLDHDLSMAMANLFKTIYFANRVHVLVKDDTEGQKHNKELQFTILIGDYIFGRILKLLVEAGADRLLDLFADMISEMNQGLIIEYKLNGDLQQVLEKTRASMYRTVFLTAAKLKALDEVLVERYGNLGFNLGMSLEMMQREKPEAVFYLQKSSEEFRAMDSDGIFKNSDLEEFLREMEAVLAAESSAIV